MSIYLVDITTFTTLFEFDCELQENRRTEIEWTDKPIEDGANLPDFGTEKAESWRVEGVVTAWPFGAPHDPQRVVSADAALRALAKAKQPVWAITGWWVAELVIKSVEGNQGQGDGEELRLTIELGTVQVPKPQTTSIPPSRLKPKVRKRAAPKPKGGAATGKSKPDNKTLTLKIFEATGLPIPKL